MGVKGLKGQEIQKFILQNDPHTFFIGYLYLQVDRLLNSLYLPAC